MLWKEALGLGGLTHGEVRRNEVREEEEDLLCPAKELDTIWGIQKPLRNYKWVWGVSNSLICV